MRDNMIKKMWIWRAAIVEKPAAQLIVPVPEGAAGESVRERHAVVADGLDVG